ncbi:MAG: hypothetical protein ACR2QC_03910 [Gammaproteobacteria bacterium]
MPNPNTARTHSAAPSRGKSSPRNAPSKKHGQESGDKRGNNPPKDKGAYIRQGW